MPESKLIESKQDLVDYMASGCRPKTDWGIGTEHEKFAYHRDTLRPLAYDEPNGIRTLLERLRALGWEAVEENGKPIALLKNGCSVTLEPGGQVELSGALLPDLHQTCSEVYRHLEEVKSIGDDLNIGFIGLGFQPKWKREDIPWMPKARYAIMQQYMPKVGELGLDMMTRTCTIQVNLDFSTEADMVKKFRTSLALQPLATALFANSPFTEGQTNGYQSYRSQIWTKTDPDRSGMLPFVFESGMGFERYVDYMLDVPMYFIYRNGKYLDASGQSFRDFLDGKLPILPGERPTVSDWEDHLTTVFPEVRLKRFLEMRGADGGPWKRICALPAFWVGLLYDQQSLDAAWDLCGHWNLEERAAFRNDVPKQGLATMIDGRPTLDLAHQVLELSEAGLERRNLLSSSGRNETQYLESLWRIVERGKSPAERKIEHFKVDWDSNIDRLFAECSY